MNENTKAVDVLAPHQREVDAIARCGGAAVTTVHVMYAVVGGEGRIYAQIGDDQVVHGFPAKFAKALAEREKYMAELMEAAGKAQDTNRDDYVLGRPDVSHMAPELRAYFLAGWDAASEAVYQTGLRAALSRIAGVK